MTETEAPPTDTVVPQTETAPIQLKSLADHVRDALAGDIPLDFARVKKSLKSAGVKIGKKDVSEDAIHSAIADLVQSGGAFKYASHPKGEDRYWAHDEKARIREAVLNASAKPQPLAKLQTAGKKLFKSQDQFVEGVLRELITDAKLHEHPPKKNGGEPLFATFIPKTAAELEAELQAAKEAKADEKRKEKEAKAEEKRKEKEAKAVAEQRQKTLAVVEALGDDPVSEAKLDKPKASAGPAVLAVYEEVLKELLDTHKLYLHGTKYGKQPPVVLKWYERSAYKKPFDKLLKAADDVLKVDVEPAQVVIGELLTRLNVSLSPNFTSTSDPDLTVEIVAFVERWADDYKAGCPFDKLYDHLSASGTPLTIGGFHDLLRNLDEDSRIRLSGWPKTLYDLPRGELALLRSDKVFYYANPSSWGG